MRLVFVELVWPGLLEDSVGDSVWPRLFEAVEQKSERFHNRNEDCEPDEPAKHETPAVVAESHFLDAQAQEDGRDCKYLVKSLQRLGAKKVNRSFTNLLE